MRGRGCIFGLALFLGTAAWATQNNVPVEVPSGQMVDLVEVLIDDNPGETWMRFRFIAPQIARLGGDVAYEVAAADLDHLCRTVALPYLAAQGVDVARVVISLSDRPVVFGDSDPDATQFFETYRPDEDRCVWEEY